MTRKLEVEIIGDPRSFQRAMDRSAKSAGMFDKRVGVLSKRMGGLTRAFGLAGAASGAAFVVGAKKAIDAALEAEKAEIRLSRAFKQAGASAGDRARSLAAVSKVSRTAALDDEDLMDTLGRLARVTGNVQEAQRGMAIAADLARGRNIELEAATKIVEKAYMGQLGALRRVGIDLPKVTAAQDALRASGKKFTDAQMEAAKASDVQATKLRAISELQRRYAGDSEAYGNSAAGAGDRARVAIENLQESIGGLLLPVVARVAGKFSEWATKLSENKQLQDDVRERARQFADVAERIWEIVKRVVAALGGWGDTLVIMGSLWVSWKVTAIASAIAVEVANIKAAAATKGAWRAALAATGWGLFAIAAGAAAAYVITHWEQVKRFFQGDLSKNLTNVMNATWKAIAGGALIALGTILDKWGKGLGDLTKKMFNFLGKINPAFKLVAEGAGLAFDAITRRAETFSREGQTLMAQAGQSWGQAFAVSLQATAQAAIDSLSRGALVRPEEGTRGPGRSGGTSLTGPTASFRGVQPETLSFARLVGSIAGEGSLNISSGRENHAKNVKGTNRPSAHSTGHAVDIGPYYGKTLSRLGVAALIAAGMSPAEAKKHAGGGLFNVNGYQIIFLTNQGGNHFNHLHVGLAPKTPTPKIPTPELPDIDKMIAGIPDPTKKTKQSGGSLGGFEAIPIGMRISLAKAELDEDPRNDLRILKIIKTHLKKLISSKKITPEQRLEVIGSLKSTNDAIEAAEKANADRLAKIALKKRDAILAAFKGLRAKVLREFDAITSAGLKQFDELTPAERELEEFRRRRADEERQRRRAEAMAIEDPYEREQALRALDLEDQESTLEERARLEREAREKERSAYEEERGKQREDLELWLDEQEEQLEKGRRSWEKFYADLRAIAKRYGFPVTPLAAPPPATPAVARAATSGQLPGPGSAAGGHVFDHGGTLKPGHNDVWNLTGRPERLVPEYDGRSGDVYVTVVVEGNVQTERDLAVAVRDQLRTLGLNNGGNDL